MSTQHFYVYNFKKKLLKMYAFSSDILCSLTDMENSVGPCLNLDKHKKQGVIE